ncbi:TIGR03089 family protein [Streptomyces oceani]|uniref:Acyl-CoA synthetase n=1 Tax=Streptomyces oceani TaxID=1075402 RepID=A0A1E7KNI2_9ACTN|nr:TIGR03089 family protein [Streptomyces oceani]OEV05467.1 acyl-CoA synthetase [Streptomyces oceani]
MNPTDRTAADLLDSALEADPSRPLVTFYDDATGERVELSVATFANWVAKTANLLQDELNAEPGDRVALLLPAHWQTAVWLIACSATGVIADVGGDPTRADVAVAGPDALEDARHCQGERVALSLRPLGARFPQTPPGFVDYAVEVPGQGDRFAPYAPVNPDLPALAPPVPGGQGLSGAPELSGAQLLERARADAERLGLGPGSRLLSLREYDSWDGLSAGLYAPLAAGASLVLCRNTDRLDADALTERAKREQVTDTVD